MSQPNVILPVFNHPPVSMQRRDLPVILAALGKLDGANLTDPKAVFRVAGNIVKIRAALNETEKVRKEAFDRISGGQPIKMDSAEASRIQDALGDLDRESVDVHLGPIKYEWLKFKDGNIPPSAIAALMPILEGVPADMEL